MKNSKTLICFILFIALCNKNYLKAQPTPWILGGNASINPVNDWLGTSGTDDLSVRTSGLDRMRLTATGQIGIGTTTPNTLLHLHQAAANTDVNFQMTNSATGSGVTDGFLMHIFPNGITELVQQEPTKPIDIISQGLFFPTPTIRMRITNELFNGFDRTRVSIGNGGTSSGIPVSTLQLGDGAIVNGWGHRTWMDYGTYISGGNDNMFIGLKNEDDNLPGLYVDQTDAVINWGDNHDPSTDNVNDLRFIFTAPIGLNTSVSSSVNGQEMARISSQGNMGIGNFYDPINYTNANKTLRPERRLEVLDNRANLAQLRLTYSQLGFNHPLGIHTDFETMPTGDLYIHPETSNGFTQTNKNVGINTSTPQATLEINSNATSITPGISGLRFTDLTLGSTAAPSNGKNLSLNSSGDVILTDDGGGSGGSGVSVCAPPIIDYITKYSSISPAEICNSNIWESPTIDQRVGIGTISFPATSKVGITAYVPSSATNAEAMDIQNIQSSNVNYSTGINMNVEGGTYAITGEQIQVKNSNAYSTGVWVLNTCDGGNGTIAKGFDAEVRGLRNSTNIGMDAAVKDARDKNYGFKANVGSFLWNANENYGMYTIATNGTENYGAKCEAYSGGKESYGVWGQASYATDKNIGVYGLATGGTINYGVYGEVYSNSCSSSSCTNAAGYFNGDVYTSTMFVTSDKKLKKNIVDAPSTWSIINALQPKTFDFDSAGFLSMNLPQGNHYGLIAQDVETLLPNLIKNLVQPEKIDSSGKVISPSVNFKAVNYIEFIPIMLAAMKEQKAEVDSLKSLLIGMQIQPRIANPASQKIELSNNQGIILNQNDPNPFSESTTITYFIPENVSTAKIIFSDNKGTVLRTAKIDSRGEGSLEVFASELSSGIYTYTLICDGKVVESKKMMKTN